MRQKAQRSSGPVAAWLAALGLGAVCGLVLASFGMPGLTLTAAAVLLIAWKGPRVVAVAGLVTGGGLLWSAALARLGLTCGPAALFPDAMCQTDDVAPWFVGSLAVFIVGLVASAFAFARTRR